jgi:hypothetical protein
MMLFIRSNSKCQLKVETSIKSDKIKRIRRPVVTARSGGRLAATANCRPCLDARRHPSGLAA